MARLLVTIHPDRRPDLPATKLTRSQSAAMSLACRDGVIWARWHVPGCHKATLAALQRAGLLEPHPEGWPYLRPTTAGREAGSAVAAEYEVGR